MKVKVRRSLAGPHIRIGAGAIIDLPEDEARYWVRLGKADFVETEIKAEEIFPDKKNEIDAVEILPENKQHKAIEVTVRPPYKKAVTNTKKKTR